MDFRDRIYIPTLIEVPPVRSLDTYKKVGAPILNQGQEGACTGFGLATVANYLLRTRSVTPDKSTVSPRMLYEMARRYDEWPGKDYDGSSARGAMKGWYKHGVCSTTAWPYKQGRQDGDLTPVRIAEAALRPLGAYFRVNHRDLVAMHSAISETGILYATASVHSGWDKVKKDGVIPLEAKQLGGHAFAIVAYDHRGFWFQNSWGMDWGAEGFGLLSYDDWLVNGTDVWVARLGAPVALNARGVAVAHNDRNTRAQSYSFQDLRPHVVTIGNNGALANNGQFANTEKEVADIFTEQFPEITRGWKKKRVLLYAHGGLTGMDSAIQRVADYRPALLGAEVYPLAFIWKTDVWTTLGNMLKDALSRRKPEGSLDSTKDFMLDRLDDALEPIARTIGGKAQWDEMKENGLMATTSTKGGGRYTLKCLAEMAAQEDIELHVTGHSAGSIFLAPLVQYLATKGKIAKGPMKGEMGLGLKIETCTLWAPACTVQLFKDCYIPAIASGAISNLALFLLADQVEQDDHCSDIYHKSLLYLVSNAFEEKARIPLFRDGEPILGMEKFVTGEKGDDELRQLFKSPSAELIVSPNDAPVGSPRASKALHHGDFDDDDATVQANLARILGRRAAAQFKFTGSASAARDRRARMNEAVFGKR